MRIGLISDTHIPTAGPDLWPQVYEALTGVDLILHGGDLVIFASFFNMRCDLVGPQP